jgi:hypothetical protein
MIFFLQPFEAFCFVSDLTLLVATLSYNSVHPPHPTSPLMQLVQHSMPQSSSSSVSTTTTAAASGDRRGEKKLKHHDSVSFHYALAGSLSGVAQKTVVQPLDLVKTRMQVCLPPSLASPRIRPVCLRSISCLFMCVYALGALGRSQCECWCLVLP